jgi:YjbE family integral membrane protein
VIAVSFADSFAELFSAAGLSALITVLVVDLVLAGDNAVVIGLSAAGLPAALRRRAILAGIAVATLLRIGFAFIAVELLEIVGLGLAGGLVLLWVAWKLYRELRAAAAADHAAASAVAAKSFSQAMWQIVIADVSMSIDNVLAVAGAARGHMLVLVIGLVISIALTGLASAFIAKLLARYRWIAYLGVAVIGYVAIRMIQEGTEAVVAASGGWPG